MLVVICQTWQISIKGLFMSNEQNKVSELSRKNWPYALSWLLPVISWIGCSILSLAFLETEVALIFISMLTFCVTSLVPAVVCYQRHDSSKETFFDCCGRFCFMALLPAAIVSLILNIQINIVGILLVGSIIYTLIIHFKAANFIRNIDRKRSGPGD